MYDIKIFEGYKKYIDDIHDLYNSIEDELNRGKKNRNDNHIERDIESIKIELDCFLGAIIQYNMIVEMDNHLYKQVILKHLKLMANSMRSNSIFLYEVKDIIEDYYDPENKIDHLSRFGNYMAETRQFLDNTLTIFKKEDEVIY